MRHRHQLQHIKDGMFLNRAFLAAAQNEVYRGLLGRTAEEVAFRKIADGSIMEGLGEKIVEWIKAQYDPEHPVASIVAFVAPDILWGFNPLLAIVYMVADALGVNFRELFTEIWGQIGELAKGLVSGTVGGASQQPTADANNAENAPAYDENAIFGRINQIVSDAIDRLLPDEVVPKKPQELAEAMSKVVASRKMRMIKIAGPLAWIGEIFGGSAAKTAIKTGGFKAFLKTLIGWICRKMWGGLVFAGVAGSIAGLADYKHKTPEEERGQILPTEWGGSKDGQPGISGQNPPQTTNSLIQKLPRAQNLPYDMTQFHENGPAGSWMVKGTVDDIEAILMKWVLSAYPVLAPHQEQLSASTAMHTVYNKFLQRNKMAQGLQVLAVPAPYETKIDIVAEIVNGFLGQYSDIIEGTK